MSIAKSRNLERIKPRYQQLTNFYISQTFKLFNAEKNLTAHKKLEVLSFLSCNKHRFSTWDLVIEEMQAGVYVPSNYDHADQKIPGAPFIEGPLSITHHDRSLVTLNYFLRRGANPWESLGFQTLNYDLWAERMTCRTDSLFQLFDSCEDYLDQYSHNPGFKDTFDTIKTTVIFTNEQMNFAENVEQIIVYPFLQKTREILNFYTLEELNKLVSAKYDGKDRSRPFISEFISWTLMDELYCFDNIIEYSMDRLFLLSEVNPYYHLFYRQEGRRILNTLWYGKLAAKTSAVGKQHILSFASGLEDLMSNFKSQTNNPWQLCFIHFCEALVESRGSKSGFDH